MKRVHLLVIDPQNDFMDVAGAALPVAGALADMTRLAAFIDRTGDGLSAITVTLDSHHSVGIERPAFWRTESGGAVAPFTPVTAAAVRAGAFRPVRADDLGWVLDYLDALERAGRYTLMVWPAHCETGTWGHNVADVVRAAYNRWEARTARPAAKVLKGLNPRTESYSALRAEVPDAQDASTQLNRALVAALDEADEIVVAGEAASHCVRATTEHLIAALPAGGAAKITLLQDCMSPVAAFEAQAAAFLHEAAARGARVATAAACADRLAAVRA